MANPGFDTDKPWPCKVPWVAIAREACGLQVKPKHVRQKLVRHLDLGEMHELHGAIR